MRALPILISLTVAACTQPHVPSDRPANACDAGAFPRSEMVLKVKVDGKDRRALVWMPPGPGPHPLVVNLHEFRSNPRTQMRYSGWADHIAGSGAIVVAPDGKFATWNAGECCGRSREKHTNDVAYLDAIVDELNRVTCLDGNVLATGIGNGAMMAQMWSCESRKPTAVVSVGGALQWPECRNTEAVPLLHYHGDADAFIPIDAAPTGLAKQEGIKRDLDHAVKLWVARNGAKLAKKVEVGALSCQEYDGEAKISVCLVKGGIDTWPGAPDGQVKSDSELANATTGGWSWVQSQWAAR